MKLSVCPALLCALFVALPATAATLPAKPGLWESTGKMESGTGQVATAMTALQEHMAAMTPEQRKSLESLIAKNGGGIALPTVAPDGALVTRACLTREMIAKSQLPTPANNHGCTHQNSPAVDGVITSTFSCTNPPARGTARFVLKDQTSYTMTMETTTTINGKSETMRVLGNGRWLGDDCGNLKPAVAAKAPKSTAK